MKNVNHKFQIFFKINIISMLFIFLCQHTILAQTNVIPYTPTLPGLKNDAFSYINPEETGISSEDLEEVRKMLRDWVESETLVGGELLILKKGSIIFHEAYGWSNKERKEPLQRNSVYNLASMAKPYTSLATLMLVEQGKLSLDDKVNKYLPNIPYDDITIHHLLSQTSGYDFTEEIPIVAVRNFNSLKEYADTLAGLPRVYPAGTYYYTDFNHVFLGQIIHEVTNQTLEEFLKEHVLGPIGATDTYFSYQENSDWKNKLPTTYLWDFKMNSTKIRWDNKSKKYPVVSPLFVGSGGIYSTALDYARFLSIWLDNENQFMSPELVKQATSVNGIGPEGKYGYGWNIEDTGNAADKPVIFGHGGIAGTSSLLSVEDDLIIIFMTSQSPNWRTSLTNKLFFEGILSHPMTGMDRVKSQDELNAMPLNNLSDYVGTYQALTDKPFRRQYEIELEGDFLKIVFKPKDIGFEIVYHLIPIAKDEFKLGIYQDGKVKFIDKESKISFIRENGKIIEMSPLIQLRLLSFKAAKISTD